MVFLTISDLIKLFNFGDKNIKPPEANNESQNPTLKSKYGSKIEQPRRVNKKSFILLIPMPLIDNNVGMITITLARKIEGSNLVKVQ